jgi:hypothetical protein
VWPSLGAVYSQRPTEGTFTAAAARLHHNAERGCLERNRAASEERYAVAAWERDGVHRGATMLTGLGDADSLRRGAGRFSARVDTVCGCASGPKKRALLYGGSRTRACSSGGCGRQPQRIRRPDILPRCRPGVCLWTTGFKLAASSG